MLTAKLIHETITESSIRVHEQLYIMRRKDKLNQREAGAKFSRSPRTICAWERSPSMIPEEARSLIDAELKGYKLTLQDKLVLLRRRKHLTQDFFAELFGCTRGWIQAMETREFKDPEATLEPFLKFWEQKLEVQSK